MRLSEAWGILGVVIICYKTCASPRLGEVLRNEYINREASEKPYVCSPQK
ncbi:MAG: hypothetical protein ACK4GN_13080 [Runella sp.]